MKILSYRQQTREREKQATQRASEEKNTAERN